MQPDITVIKQAILAARKKGDITEERRLMQQLNDLNRDPVKSVEEAYLKSFL